MSARIVIRSLPGLAVAIVLISALPAAAAETACTSIIQSAEFPIPMDDRESARQVQARVLPGFAAEGDKLAGEGKLAEAVEAFAKVFSGYQYGGVYFGDERCLSMDFYQDAADRLRGVASRLAGQRRAQGYLLDESHEYGGDIQPGALRLYLISNQYDSFVSYALEFAESELPERDIDGQLVAMVRQRLDELERKRELSANEHYSRHVNDLTPLLDEELGAFSKLAGFDEKLAARLAPLYPKITDHFLAEEATSFKEADKTDGMIQKGMLQGQATGALEAGIRRLAGHPQQVARLKARANTRGEALMKSAPKDSGGEGMMMKDHYAYAREYFEIAGNQEGYANADRLAEQRQETMVKRFEASIRTDIEKMKKSDEEQSAFQDETDDMAAEFGFDLDN